MATSNAIDLSQLTAPELITDLDYEAVLALMVSAVQEDYPEWTAPEGDFGTKILEIAAYKITEEIQVRNEAAKQSMIAYATGSNLDNLGANLLCTRLTDETDDEFRARIILAPAAYSTAGPTGAYEYIAKSSHSDIKDVRISSPNPKEVIIAVLGKSNLTPSQEILDSVAAACNDETVRPLTDYVTVQAAELIEFTIEGTIKTYTGPDTEIVISDALTSLNNYLEDVKKIGHDINIAMIHAALGVSGVQNVILTAPTADLIITETQAAVCTSINITSGGVDE